MRRLNSNLQSLKYIYFNTVYALSKQVHWLQIRLLIDIDDQFKRQCYVEMTRIENWDTQTLDQKVDPEKIKHLQLPAEKGGVIHYPYLSHPLIVDDIKKNGSGNLTSEFERNIHSNNFNS
ncbi:MAG: DUF1016 family protein [Pedobacter sp.]|nr:MAG: DUF1016 family protein [Pedobacter sp.]